MRHLDLYERRAEVLALIKSKPLATSNIARLLGQPVNAIVHDISIMSQRGWVIQDGKDEVEYATGMKRYTAWRALVVFTEQELERDAFGKDEVQVPVPDLPDNLLLMMGYNTQRQQKGRFVDNSEFRISYPVSKHRVWPGTSQVHMEAAL